MIHLFNINFIPRRAYATNITDARKRYPHVAIMDIRGYVFAMKNIDMPPVADHKEGEENKPVIVLDFDGTVVPYPCWIPLVMAMILEMFSKKNKISKNEKTENWLILLKCLGALIGAIKYKILGTNDREIQSSMALLAKTINGMPVSVITDITKNHKKFGALIDAMIYPEIVVMIAEMCKTGADVCIASSSPSFAVVPASEILKDRVNRLLVEKGVDNKPVIRVIATEMNTVIINGELCFNGMVDVHPYGPKKLPALAEELGDRPISMVCTDSSSDLPMLSGRLSALGDIIENLRFSPRVIRVLVNPDRFLTGVAKRSKAKGWMIIQPEAPCSLMDLFEMQRQNFPGITNEDLKNLLDRLQISTKNRVKELTGKLIIRQVARTAGVARNGKKDGR